MKNRAKKICSAFAENNFCEMKIDPAAARIPTKNTERGLLTAPFRRVEGLNG